MRTAREMFSDLGFHVLDYPCTIEYSVPSDYRLSVPHNVDDVDFEFDDKEVRVFRRGDMVTINMNVFKAIQKQLEELGWLDE